jgi:hypothetical protein
LRDPKREQFVKTLSEGSKLPFWKMLVEEIDAMSSPERFLGVKDEMGMRGFWYLKGYIKGQRDVKRMVNAAARAAEALEKEANNRKAP